VIDAGTGEERSSVPIDGPTGTTPAAVDDRVFFGTEGGGFFAIDYASATVAWRAQSATQGQSYRSSAAIADDLVIVGSRGKAVEAFTRRTGDRAWRRPMRGRVDGSPAVVASADGGLAVLVADAAGTILALHAETGEPRWQFDAGGGFSW
jgi:outer membrane protein assembly factor BamB